MSADVGDSVNHPPHYGSSAPCSHCGKPIECIDVVRWLPFNIGNAIKYLWRHDRKNGVEDLKKAAWYIADEIAKREKAPTASAKTGVEDFDPAHLRGLTGENIVPIFATCSCGVTMIGDVRVLDAIKWAERHSAHSVAGILPCLEEGGAAYTRGKPSGEQTYRMARVQPSVPR